MKNWTIRTAVSGDAPTLYGFILEMAHYERMTSEVDTSPEALHRALFEEGQAEALILEEEGVAVGFALYFHNFSTFRGQRGLYLEDLFVQEVHRGKGYGKALFMELVRIARERKCRRMEWVALDWNTPAHDFYYTLGAESLPTWWPFRLSETQMERLLERE